jgi:hypothetical protein
MKRKPANCRPTVEVLEDRLVPGTFTLVNDSNSAVYVELIRHMPASTPLGEGPEPGYLESMGSYKVAAGTVGNFDTGDEGVLVRVQGPNGAYSMSGPGISYAGPQNVTLQTSYDFKVDDGSQYAQVSVGGINYGTRALTDLFGSFGRSHGIGLVDGFYSFPNDYTATIHGPLTVTGSQTFPFADYCGSTDSKWVDHLFYAPHGAHINSYTVSLSSNRGDNMHFVQDPQGRYLHEYGSISGGGLFQYGGSYVGSATIHYAY